MKKPQRLLDRLLTAVPQFRAQPDQISVLVRSGRVVSTGGASLSHELAYTVQIVVLDFDADLHVITVPLLAWLRTEQPEIMDNPALRERAVRFETDFQGSGKIDLTIEVDLTERIIVSRQPAASPLPDPQTTLERWMIQPVGEPPKVNADAEQWQIVGPDGLMLADWLIQPERV